MDRSLRRAVLERLAAVEDIAVRAGSQLSVRMTRTHLKTITGGWRELLLEHQPDLRGRCPVCSGWLRRRRWPCQVWVTAHHHLIGGETPEPPGWSPKKTNPFRRPRRVEVVPRQTHVPSAVEQTGLDPAGAEHARAEHTPAVHTPAEHAGAAARVTGRPRTEPAAADQSATGELPAISLPQMPADTGEIHRAAITERSPTLPRSRRSWRSRA